MNLLRLPVFDIAVRKWREQCEKEKSCEELKHDPGDDENFLRSSLVHRLERFRTESPSMSGGNFQDETNYDQKSICSVYESTFCFG